MLLLQIGSLKKKNCMKEKKESISVKKQNALF